MNPTLFELHLFGRDLPYYSYGAMLALAFAFGIVVSLYNAKRDDLSLDHIVNLSLLIIVASIAGSRLLQVIAADGEDAGLIAGFGGGGFAFYGGFIAGVGAAVLYCRSKGVGFLRIADIMSPGLALGLMFARGGCLLAGCCWGKPVDRPLPDWALSIVDFDWPRSLATTFMHQDAHAPRGIPLVPTEIALGLTGLAIFAVLQFVVWPRRRFVGQVFAWFLILYSVGRSFWETFRDDPRGLYLGETLSTSQLISIPVLIGGIFLLRRARKTDERTPTEP